MRFLSSLVYALVLIAAPVHAEAKWVNVGSNGELTLFLDVNSIRKTIDPGFNQVWARVDYKQIQTTPNGLKFDRIERISVYNCPLSTRRAVMSVFYHKNKVVDASRANEQDVIPIGPNELGNNAVSIVCKVQ